MTIQYGNGTATSFVEGTVFIPNGAGGTLRLDNVLFDKQCPANLLSLASLRMTVTKDAPAEDKTIFWEQDAERLEGFDSSGSTILRAHIHGGTNL